MSGLRSRRKGQSGEREVVEAFRQAGFPTARRCMQSQGAVGCDVEETPFWLEVKRGKKVNVRTAIKQAAKDTDGRTPIVVWRDDREPWRVDLSLEDFLRLVGAKEV